MKKIYRKCISLLSVMFLFLIILSISGVKNILLLFGAFVIFVGCTSCDVLRSLGGGRQHRMPKLNMSLFSFFFTLMIRMIYFFIMKDKIAQISDFKVILTHAFDGDYIDSLFYYRMFPHKMIYPVFLHSMGLRDQTKIILFQFVCISLTAAMIYHIGKEIKNERAGMIALALYAIWPAHIIYSTVITEEHIAALLTICCAYLILCGCKCFKQDVIFDRKWICKIAFISFGIGVLSGICVFFKDWCIIVLIATMMIGCFILKDSGQKRIILVLSGFFLTMSSRYLTKQSIKIYAEDILEETINTQNLPCYLYVGLDPYSSGAWDRELYDEYFQMVKKEDYDYKAANSIALKELGKKITGAPKEKMLDLLLHKMKMGYGDDTAMTFCALIAMSEEDQEKYRDMFEIIDRIDHIYYLMIITSVVIAVLSLIKQDDKYIAWLLLIITGGILLNLLIECQGRYKYSIQTIWCIMAACGICQFQDVSTGLKSLVSRRRKRHGL